MLTVARLMIAGARAREESRGVHTRRDFPETDPAWARHIALIRPPLEDEGRETRSIADGSDLLGSRLGETPGR
jgi:L-aspartate oxidase